MAIYDVAKQPIYPLETLTTRESNKCVAQIYTRVANIGLRAELIPL